MTSSKILLLVAGLAMATLLGIFYFNRYSYSKEVAQMKVEEVLSIKEFQVVRHNYKDLFFLHKKNDQTKAVRAVAQVPVAVSAYLDLKDIQLVKDRELVKQVILPQARMNEPVYYLDKMEIQQMRGFQVYAGKDLYPKVSNYIREIMLQRADSIKQAAIDNDILIQTEAETLDYVLTQLKAIGRTDIAVTFKDEKNMPGTSLAETVTPDAPFRGSTVKNEYFFGFIAIE